MIEAVRLLARLIEVVGGVVIAYAMARAFAAVVTGGFGNKAIEAMRQRIAGGAVSALGLMTAATLLKTITLRTWSAIGMFAVILALRMLVKMTLAAEAKSAKPR